MANFYIQYAASVTPVEELIGADGSDKTRIIHSNIDKSVAGGLEKLCGTSAALITYTDHTTTVTTTDTPISINGNDFVFVKIREAVDDDGVCDCFIEFSGVVVSKLTEVNDTCLLRPPGLAGSVIEIYSSAGKLCKLDIMCCSEV